MSLSLATATKSVEADATARLLDGGKIKIYSGTAPANANASLGAAVLAATLHFPTPSGPASSAGVFNAGTIVPDTNAAGSVAVASFFRLTKSDDTVVMQGTVSGTGGGGDLQLVHTLITAGATVTLAALSYVRH